jgi:hypothetical protein
MKNALLRRQAAVAFLILFVAFVVAWAVNTRQSSERVAERRRSDAVVCLFLNDTRAEVRGVISDFTTGGLTFPPGLLPPQIEEAIAKSREATAGKSVAALRRLADYDCGAFIRGELPSRTPAGS